MKIIYWKLPDILPLMPMHAPDAHASRPVACFDSTVHGANMGPAWVLSSPRGSHVGPMDLAICSLQQKQFVVYGI